VSRTWLDADALVASLLAEFPGAQFDPAFLNATAADVMAGKVASVSPGARSRIAAALRQLARRSQN
jgi:hypothetical protein